MYRYIEPEVAGGLGFETEIDNSKHPPIVEKLHYEFIGWLGDDILESFPCFIVTERLKKEIIKSKLTGVLFGNVKITKSEEFNILQKNTSLPDFYWMKIYGKFNVDDFIISSDYRLIVSEKAFEVIIGFNISNATFEDYYNK
ncbi:hypothetical protein [Flavobacterium sp.]